MVGQSRTGLVHVPATWPTVNNRRSAGAGAHSLLPDSGWSVDVICWFIRCDHALIHASWVSSQFSSVAGGAGGTGER